MAKMHQVSPQSTPVITAKKMNLSGRIQEVLYILLILGLFLYLLKPAVFDRLYPGGVDVVASIAKSHPLEEYAKQSGETSLWNPNLFGGMPHYPRLAPQAWSVDRLLEHLSVYLSSVYVYYILGALGFFFMARYFGFSAAVSLAGVLFFVLFPHYKSLYLEGHMTKFRAVMFLPWILLAFRYFLDRQNILAAALFALSFGLQIRTQHYQIVFYTAVMIFAVGLYPIMKDLHDNKFGQFFKSSTLIIAAVILAMLMSAQPLFLAKEYLPYSKRGKQSISLADQNKVSARNDGVSMEYATQWSTHPAELGSWLLPRFYGGMSGETYSGDRYPQLRQRQIPGYWGRMSFTQSYEYIGIISLFFALLGLYFNRRKAAVISLFLFTLWLIFLSFGQYFPAFYSLFYNHVPYFNKFRAPMMSVTITAFVMSIFAMYGLQYLFEEKAENLDLKRKKLLYIFIGFLGLGFIFLLFSQTAGFIKPGENYDPQVQTMLSTIRADFFKADLLRYFLFLVLIFATGFFFIRQKINALTAILVVAGLTALDQITVLQRVQKEGVNLQKLEKQYFAENALDRILKSDPETFRILPVGALFNDNRWVYHHKSVGGYSPIKMSAIEELVENCLYTNTLPGIPVNPNFMKIMNVKYLISQQLLPEGLFTEIHRDNQQQMVLYKFNSYLPHAYFVGKTEVITDEYERLRRINSIEFDAAVTAILQKPLAETIETPDSSAARVINFSANKIELEVYTDRTALLVISDLFYPPGWQILMDESTVENIYQTNHAVQSIVVPAGDHQVSLRFEPGSFYKYRTLARFSSFLILAIIAAGLWMNRKK